MGGFLSALFGGQNKELNKDIGQSRQISDWSQGMGEKNLTSASNFYNAISSGDPAAIARVLAPQTDAAQQAAQQGKQTAAQFGTRSGGTTAAMAGLDDRTRAMIQQMIANLTGQAVAGEASMGEQGLNRALTANQINEQEAQQRMQNWQNSILGKGLTKGAQFAETAGLGAVGGMLPEGPGAAVGSQGALSSFFG